LVQNSQNKKSVSLILPFSQPYLKLALLNYSHPFSYGTYEIYMVTTGDKLYQKIMLENKFEFPLHPHYKLASLLNTYLISIENYSSHHSVLAGHRLKYSNSDRLSYFIEYKNGYFLTQLSLNKGIPELIHISVFHGNKRNRFGDDFLTGFL